MAAIIAEKLVYKNELGNFAGEKYRTHHNSGYHPQWPSSSILRGLKGGIPWDLGGGIYGNIN